ncbi:MAG: tetratricopeptide repeat protein, partial [Chloroflexota bacterium]
TRSSGAATRRSSSLRARFGRTVLNRRAALLVPPLLAVAVVVAVQAWPRPVAAPINNTPIVEGADGLTDVRPPGEVIAVAGVDTSDTDRRIAFWQARIAANARDDISWTYLGDLFEIKGRQTGDVANYTSARDAYGTALDIAPGSAAAAIGAARIASTLHDFLGAQAGATQVLAADPKATGALAILFDASLELGELDTAQHALTLLENRSQTPAVTGRAARLAFIRGDTQGALELSRQAVTDSTDAGDPASSLAFYNFAHAEYALFAGDLDAAEAAYEASLAALPGYPLALYGEGRVAYARGDVEHAIALLEAATAALPRPDMVAYLGDLYAVAGRTADAIRQYDTVDFIHGLAAQGGAKVYDREYIGFLADHGRDSVTAIDLAASELVARKDVYGYDALAWAQHAAGNDADALTNARLSLASGTQDARLLIHAGLIELANGLTADGQAHITAGLVLNPSFSPLVVEAARVQVAP